MRLKDVSQTIWSRLESIVKIVGTIAAIVATLGLLVPPFGNWLNQMTARRYGVTGVVKYELGSPPGDLKRAPTDNGQLYLVRNGNREFKDIGNGDLVQAITPVNFHENSDDCIQRKTCAGAPTIFQLQKGDCAIVLSRLYADDPPPDTDDGSGLKNRAGGWLRVATAACGLFK